MKKLWERLMAMSMRERMLIFVAVGIAVFYAIFALGVEPMMQKYDNMATEYDDHLRIEEKYRGILARKGKYQAQAAEGEALRTIVERSLLPGKQAEIASARLQSILKEYAREIDISIERISPKSPKDYEGYTQISLTLPFQCDIAELKDFLYLIETSDVFLYITNMNIRVPNQKKPEVLRVSLNVSGFINKVKELDDTEGDSEES